MKNAEKRKNQKIYRITLCLFIVLEIFLLCFLWRNINLMLNSDDASELILAKILSIEKKILTKSWYYSTEIRFLNTNLIYTPFFWIFKKWHTVRMCSIVIMHAIYIASGYFLCKEGRCVQCFPIVALAMITPISAEYFDIVLKGAYYIPHIVISFLGIGLLFRYINNQGMKKWSSLLISTLLAILSCMGGIRQFIVFYFPLFLTGLFLLGMSVIESGGKKPKKNICLKIVMVAGINSAGACVGYYINTHYLAQQYKFQLWNNLSYTAFDWNKLITVFNGFLKTFGFIEGPVNLKSTLSNGISVCIFCATVLALVYAWKKRTTISKEYHIIAIFYVMNVAVFTLLYTMTDMVFKSRYNQPIAVFSFLVIAMWIRELDWISLKKMCLYGCYCVSLLLGGILVYKSLYSDFVVSGYQKEKITIANMLVKNGYYQGYASFWNANILTELSDGEIDMYDFGNTNDPTLMQDVNDINQMFPWLQLVKHDYEKPKGKVFILLTKDELYNCNWRQGLENRTALYESDTYILYCFDNHEEMMDYIGDTTNVPR